MRELQQSPNALEVFFSYSHQDEEHTNKLAKHLSILQRQGVISNWRDRNISAGAEWEQEIKIHLDSAQIILLLISDDFLASDYCWEIELTRAMERHETGQAIVIPVIVRPVDWQDSQFGKLQALPKNGKPITTWENQDQGWLNVAQGIRQVAKQLSQPQGHVIPKQQSVNSIQRRHLEQKLTEQKQEYADVNEEIEFLSTAAKTEDLSPKQSLLLQRQIAAAQQKREEIASQIEELEHKIDL